jgi:hypothetical protein
MPSTPVSILDLWRAARAADVAYAIELRRVFRSRANRLRGLHPTVCAHFDVRLSKAALDYRRARMAWRYGASVRLGKRTHDSGTIGVAV